MKNTIKYRRIFHQYPETGWLTYFSTVYIANILEQAGYRTIVGKELLQGVDCMDAPTSEQIAQAQENARKELSLYLNPKEITDWFHRLGEHTGLIAIWDTQREGKTKAYRFDMDALFVTESTIDSRLPVKDGFCSKVPGVSHACGHDGHMAIGLSFALDLIKQGNSLTGKYIFIFQPAEEGVRGAMAFCNAWKYGKIDELYCCHIGFAPKNTFVAGTQGFLATTKFDVHFLGKSAHAGLAPERGRNALMAAVRSAMEMENIKRPDTGITRLNVGQLHGGESRNTIPEKAWIQMETRGETAALNEYMRDHALACIKTAAKHYGVSYEISYKGESVSASSSESLTHNVLACAQKQGLFEHYLETYHFGASDDGAVFMDMVQRQGGEAVYILFGCETTGLNHESIYDFDEAVLEKALAFYMTTL